MKTNSKNTTKKLHIALFLIITIIVLGITTFFIIIKHNRTQLLDLFGERSFSLATFTVTEIDRTIQDNLHTVQTLTKRLAEEDILTNSNKEFGQLINPEEIIQTRDQEWLATEGTKTNELMQELVNNQLSKRLSSEFSTYKHSSIGQKYIPFSEIFLTNAYGTNVAQTNRTSDYYQADEDWWQQAKSKGIHVSDVAYDDSSEAFAINISTAIKAEDGTFLGVVKVVWNIEEIIDQLRVTELKRKEDKVLGKSTHLTLINTTGKIIYDSNNKNQFFDLVAGDLQKIIVLASHDEQPYEISVDEETNTARLITFAHSTGFGEFKGLDWTLVIQQNTKEILRPLLTTQIYTGIILSLFILTTIYLNFVYARHLKAIQKLKDEFISVTSHQLKTPLTKLKLSLEMLNDIRLPVKAKEWTLALEENTEAMIKLVHDLLNLSRLESGRLEIVPVKTNLITFTKEIIEKHQGLIKNKKQTLKLNLPKKSHHIPIDPSVYELIFSNLLSNAIKYSGNKTTIKISLTIDKNGYLFAISDQGIGIPKEDQESIFSKFYRTSNAKAYTSGTGLGLFVIHQIAKGIGGKIWFESITNKGTTFFFQLPITGMKKGKVKTT